MEAIDRSNPRFEMLYHVWEREGRPLQPFTFQGKRWQALIEDDVVARFLMLGTVDAYRDVKGSFGGRS